MFASVESVQFVMGLSPWKLHDLMVREEVRYTMAPYV